MNFPFGETVTWLQRSTAGTDPDGNDAFTWTPVTVCGCVFVPAGSIEKVQGQDLVVDNPTLYVPAGTNPSPYDRFVRAGVTYEVVGSPNSYDVHPFTGTAFPTVIQLQVVNG